MSTRVTATAGIAIPALVAFVSVSPEAEAQIGLSVQGTARSLDTEGSALVFYSASASITEVVSG